MYRCFTDTEEAELTDDCAQSYFDFFHGKSHADTVTRPHSKRKKSVRVTFSFVIGAPPVSEIVHMVTHGKLLLLFNNINFAQMISTSSAADGYSEKNASSAPHDIQMISISSAADGNSEINALSAHMEMTSFFARPVATQESSLPSLPVQERSRSGDRSHRGNGLRKWHIEPAAGKRY